MEVYSSNTRDTNLLSQRDRHTLEVESDIDSDLVDERGYETVKSRVKLLEFKKYQRRPGLRIPMYSPDSVTRSSQLKPQNPRVRDGKAIKYETAGGSHCILDVHPRRRDEARDGDGDLYITEGIKKADSLTSRGLCTVGIIGVWNWQRKGEMLPCWDHINLDGRRVYIVFDSDVVTKPEVQLALERLVAALEERGANVMVVYLPHSGEDKTGVDDYLVAGGTVSELKMLARKYEPSEIGKIRLSKDDKLQAGIVDLERRFWSEEWQGMGGHSDRDVALKLIEAAKHVGKVVAGGIRVVKAQGPLALEAKVSGRTLWKALKRLEERGFCYRDNEGRKGDKTGAFVLRADVSHYGKKLGHEGNVTQVGRAYDRDGLHLRAPRLLWSKPKFTPKRGTVTGTRKVRQGPKLQARDGVTRLGKIRGAILDVLDAHGGTATLQEIADALHRKRPRDIRRRNLPMLEEAGIITVEDSRVSLTDNWLDALEDERRLGGEIDSITVLRYETHQKDENGRKEVEEKVIVAEGAETRARRRYENRQRKFSEDIRYFKAVCKQDGRSFTWSEFWSWRATHGVSPHWTNDPDADGPVEYLERIGDLPAEDLKVLKAILDFEEKFGRRSFKWNQSGAKELFYSFGEWPSPDQLRRIREHIEIATGVSLAA